MTSGNVITENNASLKGVSVNVKGCCSTGTITDASGKFTIQVSKSAILVFSFVGNHENQVPVNNESGKMNGNAFFTKDILLYEKTY